MSKYIQFSSIPVETEIKIEKNNPEDRGFDVRLGNTVVGRIYRDANRNINLQVYFVGILSEQGIFDSRQSAAIRAQEISDSWRKLFTRRVVND
jgi:hypothetical protein